jgi:Tol biopolymer transport system component
MCNNWAVISLLTLMAAAGATPAGAGTTNRVSIGPRGVQGNGYSEVSAISANGRFVAFSSDASNLVPGDRNDAGDVFVRDLVRNETYLISTTTGHRQGDRFSERPAISADGRFVCFDSFADNLVPGDTNGDYDMFLRDRARLTTTRINVRPRGLQSKGFIDTCDISASGRYVAFDAAASRLVAGDTNDEDDIFIYDRLSHGLERANLGAKGAEARGGYSILPSISANGRFVAFQSTAVNLVGDAIGAGANIYVRDRAAGTTTLASRSVGGTSIDLGVSNPAISGGGRFVAFDSNSTNLVPNDTNDADDVFVYDLQTGKTTRVSVGEGGRQANGDSGFPSISDDGRLVAFHSAATNLVKNDTNGVIDVFVHDRITGLTSRVSVASSGAQANGESSYHFAVSPRGDIVVFTSEATNLVPGDTNGQTDVFLRRLDAPGS